MATNLIQFQPHSVIRASATTSDHRKNPESNTKNWWTPLFGWSSEPDYIGPTTTGKICTTINKNNDISSSTDFTRRSNRSLVSESESEQRPVRSRGVKFTDEKAKKLRMLTSETESFHDAMYHSAIASRFASDFSGRST